MDGWKDRLVYAPALVALLGLAFVIGGVTLWFLALAPAAGSPQEALFDLVMHVLFGGVILILGIHIERSELSEDERFAVFVWCYGGFSFMLVLSVWGHIGSLLDGGVSLSFASDFVVFTSLGGAFGVISGVNWGHATKNRLLAERNEAQRETLALLTRLLSHDIRNDLSLVQVHAETLREHVDGDGESSIDVILDRIGETDQLLATANTLLKSLDEERDFAVFDVSTVLEREVAVIADEFPAVTVETDIPGGLRVEADDLIDQLFTNLLQNAVFHNDVEELTIQVTAERTDDQVHVVIADDGTGISPELRDSCFELGEQGPESDGDGIGLYLVSRLAEVYGGSVELDESPSGGARFHIALPAPAE